jgi:pilus assembly protein Flp/PilA
MKFPKRETGQGLVEYALILVLVAIVVIAILLALGPRIGGVFSGVVDCLEGNGCDPANFGGGGYTYQITTFNVGGSTGPVPNSCTVGLSSLIIKVTDENGQGVDGVSVTPSISFPGGSPSLSTKTTSGGGNVNWTGGSWTASVACTSGTATASAGGTSRTAGF